MRDNSCKERIDKIMQEAPTARKALLDNHSNLHKVADYCQNKNLNVQDSGSVIEESKALTTQALASVTYQINSLATSMLKLLDAQMVQLKQVEFSVNLLTLTVGMYKEKISRKEIGVLTKQSKVAWTEKMVLPASGLEPIRVYRRVPISYTRLDKLGHGHWEGRKTEEPKTDNEESVSVQPGTQEPSTFNWSFLGIAVPPPSVPGCVGSSVSAPPDLSSASPPPSLTSDRSPSLPAHPDLSMLPPPPFADDEMGVAPPPPSSVYGGSWVPPQPPPPGQNTSLTSANHPPPPPFTDDEMGDAPPPPFSPPPPSSVYGGSWVSPSQPPPGQNTSLTSANPPPPPFTDDEMGDPPPPSPPPPSSVNGGSWVPPPLGQNTSLTSANLPPPPPPFTDDEMGDAPPPPPSPPPWSSVYGGSWVPPSPPPPGQNISLTSAKSSAYSRTPQNASIVPPPPPPITGGKFVPPPPPPPPPF
ncbi:formin-like protein 5 [Carassius auratus]|uniref:Formin-like protein 5 n=1 Tax=Carassius auratus TaxID=7957 RepID=A0A6P6L2U1_CARAU|nr:formin-like protein 5 [Carassius auratus]